MSENNSTRTHIHTQKYTYRFQSESLAPLKRVGGVGKPRFSVEPMVYVSAVGWEIIDPMASGNELMIGFRNYVRMKEFMGYEHTGLSSDEITTFLTNLWGKGEDDW